MSIEDILKLEIKQNGKIDWSSPKLHEKIEQSYDGFGILELYDDLNSKGKLVDSLPFASLYLRLPEDSRLDLFPAFIGFKAITNPNEQKRIFEGNCSSTVLQSLSAFNEFFPNLNDTPINIELKNKIVTSIIDSECPIKIIPSSILHDKTYISEYCKRNWDLLNDDLFYAIMNASCFYEKLEEILLEELRVNSLEEFLKNKFFKEHNLSSKKELKIELIDLVVARLYTLKLLDKNKTYLNELLENPYRETILTNEEETKGSYFEGIIEVFPFLISTIKELVETSSHEAYHAIQDNHIKTGNILVDPDVDVYSIDAFLREAIGEEYYIKNYTRIGIEHDAQVKALIDIKNIEGAQAKKKHVSSLMSVIEQLSKEENDKLEQISADSGYWYLTSRFIDDYHTMDMFELFEDVVNMKYRKAQDKKAFVDELISKYPIFGYILKFDKEIKIKNISDYIEDFSVSNQDEANIYLQLICNLFNVKKFPKEKNLEVEIKKALKDISLTRIQESSLAIAIGTAIDKYGNHLRRGQN